MIEALLIICTALLLVAIALLVMVLRKTGATNVTELTAAITSSHERTERAVREEIARNRTEATDASRAGREEMANSLKTSSDTLINSVGELGRLQKSQLDGFAQRLDTLTTTLESKLDAVRQESLTTGQRLREEVNLGLKQYADTLTRNLGELGSSQRTQLGNVVEQVSKLTDTAEKRLEAQRIAIDERLKTIQTDTSNQLATLRSESQAGSKQQREESASTLKAFNDSVVKSMGQMAEAQQKQIATFSDQLSKLTESNQQKLEGLRVGMEEKLKEMQQNNAEKLELMRATVDEKLQGTLEKRLGESFTLISTRLEAVAKGLGEMQVLASGVDDLRKVFSNVKNRGGWGEVQLGAMLEQILTPEQYATNVATTRSGERVEYAVRLPGRGENADEIVWLPIDAKFPLEDYQRLVQAQESGDVEAADMAGRQLEIRIKACASDICRKYLAPPHTTDFGILYLPTEGLFAEVVRRVGLVDYVQRECRVVIAGPTTLWSLLNSLQMGFRTLAIQKRSSEVWTLLSAVKTEFGKYGEVMEKVKNKLDSASSEIENVARRSRAIDRKLRTVQELPADQAGQVLLLDTAAEQEITV